MKMVHSIPSEFTDEDKWFKFFKKRNLVVIAAGLGVTGFFFKIATPFGLGVPLGLFGIVVTVIATIITMIPLPETNYLKGGGQTLDVILLRRYIRKKNKKIYIKGYGADKEE